MSQIEKRIKIVVRSHGSRYDDFVDRLSSRYTVIMLVGFAVVVTLLSKARNPINCWAPNHFSSSKAKFANNYCWVKNTYYLPWEKEIPKESEARQWITYYQWVPFILIAQAVLFHLPKLIWHGLNSKAGVDADNILAAAHTFSMTDKVETRERTLKMLTSQIDRFLHSQGDKKKNQCDCELKSVLSVTCCRLCGKRFGNYLLLIFLFSKVCYIANCIGQLFLLNHVLSMKYSSFGVDLAKLMAKHKDWTEDSYVAFPRVTLCDFKVRGEDMANVFRYTLQCVLPINIFNEKIFLFQWYWMILVGSVSVLSFVVWSLRAALVIDRKRFVRNHINSALEWRKKSNKNGSTVRVNSMGIKVIIEVNKPGIDNKSEEDNPVKDNESKEEDTSPHKDTDLKEDTAPQKDIKLDKDDPTQSQSLLDKDTVELRKNSIKIGLTMKENNTDRTRDSTQGINIENETNKDNDAKTTFLDDNNKQKMDEFTTGYLRQDGLLLLRLIAHNTDNITTTDVMFSLWKLWKERDKIDKDR